ncbi:hypothetical protein D3C78_1535790 [compost metagenome]
MLPQRHALLSVRAAAYRILNRAAGLSAVQPQHYSLVGGSGVCLCAAAPVPGDLPQFADERTLSLQLLGRNLRFGAGVPPGIANRRDHDFPEVRQVQRDG